MLRAGLLVCALAALAAGKEEEAALPEFAHHARHHQAVRPTEEQVKTKVGLTLIDVDLDEERNLATLSGWLMLQWTDPKSAWSAAEVSQTRVHPSDIWVPDILPYDSVLPAGQAWLRETLAVVYPDGRTLYVPPCTVQTRCQRQVAEHKDRVSCAVTLGSWTYTEQELDLVIDSDTVDTSFLVANGRWAVDRTSVKRVEKKYDCCPGKYVSLDVQIVLKPQRS